MAEDKTKIKPSYWRRALAVLVCFSPLELIVVSLGWGMVHRNHGHLFGTFPRDPYVASMAAMLLALLVAAQNAYLSWIRPRLFRHRPGYHWISGFPIIGTFLVIVGTLLGFGMVRPAALGIIALLFDTGGSPWFLVATWRDSGLWDE